MSTKSLVRDSVRRSTLGERLIAEWHVRQLSRSEDSLEFRECQRLSRPGTVALDIGAYNGAFALGMAKKVGGEGQVIALEPFPDSYQLLRRVARGTVITPLNLAASNRTGPAELRIPIDAQGGSVAQLGSLEDRDFGLDAQTIPVQLIRADDVVGPALPVSLVKIDVEGHEQTVLEGLERIIARDKPSLVVEIEQRHLAAGRTIADIVEPLIGQGYTCRALARRTLIPWSQFDVEKDQLRYVDGNGVRDPRVRTGDYGNNFVFTA